MGVQFEPIPGFNSLSGARLSELWGADYPVFSDQPPLDRQPPLASPQPGLFVEVMPFPGVRHWFTDLGEEHLLQVQRDRLVANWKRRDGGDYPRFDEVRRRFDRAFSDLSEWHAVAADQIEVTYINSIEEPAYRALRWFTEDAAEDLQGFSFTSHWRPDMTADSLGSLQLSSAPSECTLVISVRAEVDESTDLSRVIEDAHLNVVDFFGRSTTDAMHQAWGENQ